MKHQKLPFCIALLVLLVCLHLGAHAQRGGRIGLVMGLANTKINNVNDANAPDEKLLPISTLGWQRGIEFGYSWRYFGIGGQLMGSQFGQNYKLGNTNGSTKLNYIRPTVLVNGTTNTKNNVRGFIQFGGYYGILVTAKEMWTTRDPATGVLDQVTILNNLYTQTGTQNITGTLSNGIYYKSDAGVVAAVGGEFRFRPKWLIGITMRMDVGMESLENYNKEKLRYTVGTTSVSGDYEHWRNTPYKYRYESFYNGVRTPSTNSALGAYLSLKYVLQSNTVLLYEMDGY
jgi:hypothetical protein